MAVVSRNLIVRVSLHGPTFCYIFLKSVYDLQTIYEVVNILPNRPFYPRIIKRFKHMRRRAAFSIPGKAFEDVFGYGGNLPGDRLVV